MNRNQTNQNKLVSILMPTYNVESYVDEAICSILNQTYSNIELIIVDDCSTDETYQRALKYETMDSRVHVYRNTRNLKIALTLNRCLESAVGYYIARMDGDDISEPQRIERLVDYIECNKGVDLVGSYTVAIDEHGNPLAKHRLPVTDKWIGRTMPLCSSVQHIWLCRSEVYSKLGGYRDYPGAEDYDFLLRARRSGFVLANDPEYLYRVRLREGNTESTEGLNRVLTKKYVYRISRTRDSDDVGDLEADYKKYLLAHSQDKERYARASRILAKAKSARRNPLLMAILAVRASITSRYIFEYLLEVIGVRVACLLERGAN